MRISILFFLFGTALLGKADAYQSETELNDQVDRAVGHINDRLKDFDRQSDEITNRIERDLEKWADEYSADWEKWADQLERRLNRWAEEQEQVWEDWSRRYSREMERFTDAFEETIEELNPEQFREIIESSLEMLSEMPIGELVEGIIDEGTEGFESAPWESLGKLKTSLQESAERIANETDRRLELAELKRLKEQESSEALDYLMPIEENSDSGHPSSKNESKGHVKSKLKRLKAFLQNEDLNEEVVNKILQEVEQAKRDQAKKEQNRSTEIQRRLRLAKEESIRQNELATTNKLSRQLKKLNLEISRTKAELKIKKEQLSEFKSKILPRIKLEKEYVKGLEKLGQTADLERARRRLASLQQQVSGSETLVERTFVKLEELNEEAARLKRKTSNARGINKN